MYATMVVLAAYIFMTRHAVETKVTDQIIGVELTLLCELDLLLKPFIK